MKATTTTADGPTFRAVSRPLGRIRRPHVGWDTTATSSRPFYAAAATGAWTPHTAATLAAIAAENAQAASGVGGVIY